MASIINATTSTGLVSSADNSGVLQLATNNGTTAVTIDTSQNVGIGISSPTCVLDVVGGIKTSRTAVTSPASTDGNVFSGTYTPTQVSTNTNVDSVTFSAGQYMRVGSTVTVSGLIQIDPTATATQTIVKFSLPISSAFTNSFQLGGTGSSSTNTFYGTVNAAFIADTVNDCVEMRFTSTSTSAVDFRFHFTYRVI